MHGGQKQKMINWMAAFFFLFLDNAVASTQGKPGSDESLPCRVMLITARLAEWSSRARLPWKPPTRVRATPDAAVITRWRRRQPLGPAAAALAMWTSQIKAASNLLWSVRGNTRWRWWSDGRPQSETAQLISGAVRSRGKCHRGKLSAGAPDARVLSNALVVNFTDLRVI